MFILLQSFNERINFITIVQFFVGPAKSINYTAMLNIVNNSDFHVFISNSWMNKTCCGVLIPKGGGTDLSVDLTYRLPVLNLLFHYSFLSVITFKFLQKISENKSDGMKNKKLRQRDEQNLGWNIQPCFKSYFYENWWE